MKSEIIEGLSMYLLKQGFTIKCLTRTCFDLFARRRGQILLVKVLEDANAVSKEYAQEMEKIAAYIKASPLIVAEKAGHPLQNGVVYSRFNMFTLNSDTFKATVANKLPFVFSSKAGLTASIQGEKLRKRREEEGLSLSGLSRKVAVSARMISKYENQGAEITVNKAIKLYDTLGGDIFRRIDVFSYRSMLPEGTSEVSRKYAHLGFTATETKRAPFDIIAKRNDELILTEVGDKDPAQLNSLSRLIDADKLVIFKKKKPKDIPSLTKEEFMDFEKANELITFLKEF